MKLRWMLLVLLLVLASCAIEGETNDVDSVIPVFDEVPEVEETVEVETEDDFRETNEVKTKDVSNWQNTELKDISTGATFTIDQFKGKPVLLESFAVWCPTCTKQQQYTKSLHDELGDSVISVALDTDPNEDESKVKAHIERNGFDWYYAIAPVELTRSLIDEFGLGIASAPLAPMVLICSDGSSRFLKSGVKTVEDLKKSLDAGC
jgi:thiol-disulfide isomerase/thioredoxin